ncbi:STM4013/SEN3800 family hydrolase [Deinococcus maricopensis]|uniref:Metalloenzyme domain protein n=1 Tax=Deinococcus maricopensis (strain DSM 21211 / LMG 22137 / NRRL B-23946 / LB-34) TaxID=709986 RepID=E8U326_DEIML|nr:STM4013/SEN3800 family hydrolase [Deinococcus maricopensis]ADV65764.1 metalloenzyme domain protein [Deinococcus maricopensis DSM 21211]
MLSARDLIPDVDVVLITLDSLRYDVADAALRLGETPHLAALLPGGAWEARHTPGSFTYAAHHAFLSGFLPTPARPGRHARLFAARFEGSTSTAARTFTFDEGTLPAAFAARGYRTVCVGGVGFFNGRTALGSALPALFHEAHWTAASGVQNPDGARVQMRVAAERLRAIPERVFLLMNVAATHTPTHFYVPGARRDSPDTQRAALRTVDAALPTLLDALRARGDTLLIVCADHGTCFGEDGYWGHRIAHPNVWTVPYAELLLRGRA